MSDQVLIELKQHITDEIARVNSSSGDSIERLFFDFKSDIVKELTILQGNNREMIGHQKETNGRVKKLEAETERLEDVVEEKATERDVKLKEQFWLTMKVFAFGFVFGTFLWIKESRDFIIAHITWLA